MPSSYFDSNADDRHDRDFARFQSDEKRRRAVVSEREISSVPTQTTMVNRPPLATPPLPHLDTPEERVFEKDLQRLINCYSQENGSDTPDFILAKYLQGCLDNFNATLQAREKWYGREIHLKVAVPDGFIPPNPSDPQ